jgi:adenylate cyclase
LIVFATGLALVALFWVLEPFSSLQDRLSDVALFTEQKSPQGIVIAQIDDRSLDTYGRFGDWPRTLHAQAVSNLKAAGARVIVFDILFVEPSPEDVRLAEAIGAAGNVILPVAGVQSVGTDPDERYVFQATLLPPEPLKSAAQQLGHVNFPPDNDGVLRRMPLYIEDVEGNRYPSALLSALYAQTLRKAPLDAMPEDGRLSLLNQNIPVDEAGAMRPYFASGLEQYTRISYADAIAGRLPQSELSGRIVLIGLTATGSGDTHITPLGGEPEAGVAVLGNVLASLNDGVFVREANRNITGLALLPLIGVTMYAVPRFNLRVAALLLLLVAIGTYILSIALFNSDQKVIMNLVYPAILLPAMYLVGLGHRITAERADRREISDLFGRYASPQIMEALSESADRGELNLGGTLREVTVLFADLRGFTGVSERLPPAEVVMFLNQAFEIMIQGIVRNDGIVNKFGGDMVMGIWNAPHDVDDHAVKACRAAAEALNEMAARDLSIPDDPDAKFGFGINTGLAVAGNVGSAGRLEYSVIGDPVNVGSRLCGIAGGGEIYIGERTRELAGHHVEVEPLGPQTLKGRSKPVEAFKVLSVDGAVPARTAVAVR